jgi:hypothetical protein
LDIADRKTANENPKGPTPLIPVKFNTGEIHFSPLSFARAARSSIEL